MSMAGPVPFPFFSLSLRPFFITKVVSSNSVQGEVYSIQHYVIQFVSDLRQVGGFLYTTLCDTVCQWLATGRWFSLYNIMWYSLSVTCDRSVVFSIQHYVIKFVSDLWQVGGFLYTTLCDTVCQWLATGRWFSPVLRFSQSIKLTATRYNWNIVENGV
jgi:hypothetical protein